jgi:hypothetical protein
MLALSLTPAAALAFAADAQTSTPETQVAGEQPEGLEEGSGEEAPGGDGAGAGAGAASSEPGETGASEGEEPSAGDLEDAPEGGATEDGAEDGAENASEGETSSETDETGATLTNFGSFTAFATTDWYTGHADDTSYTLSTIQQLLGLAVLVNGGTDFTNKTIVLGIDINLTGNLEPFAPIGTAEHPFNGTFDGAGKTLTNLQVIAPQGSYQYVGFFGHTGPDSLIKDLGLTGGSLTLLQEAANGPQLRFVGSIVGFCEGAIENCSSSMAINVTSQRAAIDKPTAGEDTRPTNQIGAIREIGGLVGHLDRTMSNCRYTGTLSVTSASNILEYMTYTAGDIGGLVGRAGNPADIETLVPSITGSTNSGTLAFNVTGSGGTDRFGAQLYSASFAVGGIVGYSTGTIKNCTNTGDILTSPDAEPATAGYQAQAGYGASSTGGIVGMLRGSDFDVLATHPPHEITTDPGFTLWKQRVEANAPGADAPPYPNYVKVSDCTNTGLVVGLTGVGGIAGSSGSFTELIGNGNSGDVRGCRWNKPFVGGVIGTSRSDVRYCFNRGNLYSVTGAGYYCAGIAGGFSSAVTPATADKLRYPPLEMTGCYVAGQVMLTASGYRTGILAGESSGYLHDNVYMPNVTIDKKVVWDDTGTLANNVELAPADIKDSRGIALLNSYAASLGQWKTFYLPANGAENNGFPVVAHSFNTSGIDLSTSGAVASLADKGDAVFSTEIDPVPTINLAIGAVALRQNADFYVIPAASTQNVSPSDTVYQATIKGMGRYVGALPQTVSYRIVKASIADCTIVVRPTIFNWKVQNPALHPEWVSVFDPAGTLIDSSQYELRDLYDGSDGTKAKNGRYYDYINAHGANYKYDVCVRATDASASYTGETTQQAFRIEWASMQWIKEESDPPRPESVHYGKVRFNGEAICDFFTGQDDESGEKVQIAYTGAPVHPKISGGEPAGTDGDWGVTYLFESANEPHQLRDGTGVAYWDNPLSYDYKYVYGNPNPEEGNDKSLGEQINVTAPGGKPECMTLRFTPGGNFDSYVNVFYRIVPRPLDGSLPNGVYGGGLALTYGIAEAYPLNGTTVRPAVQLRIGETLIGAEQYTVSYGENDEIGADKGSVTLTAASANLSGSITLYFDIEESLFKGNAVTLSTALTGGRNIDIPGRSTKQGEQAIIWSDTVGANQRFYVGDAGVDGQGEQLYYFQNVNSGLVLDINGANISKGAAIIQWPYKGSNNQKWYIEEGAGGSGTYVITSALNPAYCLDIYGGQNANGAKLILWERTGGANQSWDIAPITPSLADGTYTIRTAGAGNRSLDVEGASLQDGARMLLWDFHGQTNQQFTIHFLPETGYYTIVGLASQKSVDVFGNSTASGTQIIQWTLHGQLNQQWSIADSGAGNGTLAIIGARNNLSLDVYGGNVSNNGRIIAWPYHGQYNQQWLFDAVG